MALDLEQSPSQARHVRCNDSAAQALGREEDAWTDPATRLTLTPCDHNSSAEMGLARWNRPRTNRVAVTPLAEIADSFFKPAVRDLVPYEPGKPVEEVRASSASSVVKLLRTRAHTARFLRLSTPWRGSRPSSTGTGRRLVPIARCAR